MFFGHAHLPNNQWLAIVDKYVLEYHINISIPKMYNATMIQTMVRDVQNKAYRLIK